MRSKLFGDTNPVIIAMSFLILILIPAIVWCSLGWQKGLVVTIGWIICLLCAFIMSEPGDE